MFAPLDWDKGLLGDGDIEDVLTHQCRLLSHPCLLLQHVSWLLGQVDRFTDHTRICSNHNDSTLSPLSSTWNKQSYELCWREWFQSFCISFVLKSSFLYLKSVFLSENFLLKCIEKELDNEEGQNVQHWWWQWLLLGRGKEGWGEKKFAEQTVWNYIRGEDPRLPSCQLHPHCL